MLRYFALVAAVALAGCSSQLQSDLGKAGAPCRDATFTAKLALAQCLDRAQAPVWAKDEPKTFDLYREFAAGRAALAKERDAGDLSEKDYDNRLDALAQDLHTRIEDRRKAPD